MANSDMATDTCHVFGGNIAPICSIIMNKTNVENQSEDIWIAYKTTREVCIDNLSKRIWKFSAFFDWIKDENGCDGNKFCKFIFKYAKIYKYPKNWDDINIFSGVLSRFRLLQFINTRYYFLYCLTEYCIIILFSLEIYYILTSLNSF